MKLSSLALVTFAVTKNVSAFMTSNPASGLKQPEPSQLFVATTDDMTQSEELDSNSEDMEISSSTEEYTEVVDEVQKFERSEAVPFLLRPQKLKGYVGDVGFDPAGYSEDYSMEYLREAELKHGRIAMLAWTGWVAVDLGARIYPFPEVWQEVTSLTGKEALLYIEPGDPRGFFGTPLAFALYLIIIPEWYFWSSVNEMNVDGKSSMRVAGDLGWDVLGILKGKSEEEINDMKLKELKHARLGMLAFSGLFAQTVYAGGETFPYF